MTDQQMILSRMRDMTREMMRGGPQTATAAIQEALQKVRAMQPPGAASHANPPDSAGQVLRDINPPPAGKAAVMEGRRKADSLRVLVVPGSARVRLQAEAEGLDQIFLDFGAEWRNAGCSMCLGMNPDQLAPGERSASTSNRNFEGRQGKGGRTHLVSPLVAAATAIRGTLSSLADLDDAVVSASASTPVTNL